MAKAKGSKKEKTKVEVSAEGKSKLKAALKEMKAERDKVIAASDKKALKAIRYKIKKANRTLKSVSEALARENAKKKAEAAPAEG